MSFQYITEYYQEQLNEFASSEITDDVMDEIRLVLTEYCYDLEMRYGVEMQFKVWYEEKDKKLKYEVVPVSDLDALLLKHVVENESSIGTVSMALN